MKIYGGYKVLWQDSEKREAYLEANYKEYRADGSLKQTGTEDFSSRRWATLPIRFVYVWDGEKRNKGGHRWFEYLGAYRVDDPKELKRYIEVTHTDAALVQVRTK